MQASPGLKQRATKEREQLLLQPGSSSVQRQLAGFLRVKVSDQCRPELRGSATKYPPMLARLTRRRCIFPHKTAR